MDYCAMNWKLVNLSLFSIRIEKGFKIEIFSEFYSAFLFPCTFKRLAGWPFSWLIFDNWILFFNYSICMFSLFSAFNFQSSKLFVNLSILLLFMHLSFYNATNKLFFSWVNDYFSILKFLAIFCFSLCSSCTLPSNILIFLKRLSVVVIDVCCTLFGELQLFPWLLDE